MCQYNNNAKLHNKPWKKRETILRTNGSLPPKTRSRLKLNLHTQNKKETGKFCIQQEHQHGLRPNSKEVVIPRGMRHSICRGHDEVSGVRPVTRCAQSQHSGGRSQVWREAMHGGHRKAGKYTAKASHPKDWVDLCRPSLPHCGTVIKKEAADK